MMKKCVLLIIVCLFIFSACSYHIAGYGAAVPTKFYIEQVVNKTRDTSYGTNVQYLLDRYFIKYGEMTSYDKANFYLYTILESVGLKDDIVSATDEAVSSQLGVSLQIIVVDKSGAEVFAKKYSSVSSFSISSNVSQSLKNRASATQASVQNILDSFRNDFNSRLEQ